MAKLKVFISSTYYDLKHVRSYVGDFIQKMGYEAIMSEKGRIAYNPDHALDKSCYRESESSDIFILILGGRYGSAVSDIDTSSLTDEFYQQYESVTQKEFDAAQNRDIPTYILVEKSVMAEYETFKKNRKNTTINYAHVDSVNIFHFLDSILERKRNNATYQFEQAQEIELWLREQWSGYFKEILEKRSQNKQLNSLTQQVSELKNVTDSLQRYIEEVIQKVAGGDAIKIIKDEQNKLTNEILKSKLMSIDLVRELVERYDFSLENAIRIYRDNSTIPEIIQELAKASDKLEKEKLTRIWTDNIEIIDEINQIKDLLGAPSLNV